MKPWKLFCKVHFRNTDNVSIYIWPHLSPTCSPSGSRIFLLLPFLEFWRKAEPTWLRRSLANLAYVLPWPSLRQFKASIDATHPVFAQAFYDKKEAFNKGGIEALTNTASGGRDLTTLLSESRLGSVLPMIELADDCNLTSASECGGGWRGQNAWRNCYCQHEVYFQDPKQSNIFSDGFFSFPSAIILGGQETTSGAMSRLLDLMTFNPSLQTWLREEITEALAVCDRKLQQNDSSANGVPTSR